MTPGRLASLLGSAASEAPLPKPDLDAALATLAGLRLPDLRALLAAADFPAPDASKTAVLARVGRALGGCEPAPGPAWLWPLPRGHAADGPPQAFAEDAISAAAKK